MENWGSYVTAGGDMELNVVDGALKADVKSVGELNYGVQLSTGGFKLIKGAKYVLKFDVSSTAERKIEGGLQQNGGDYKCYAWNEFNITPETQTMTMEFTMKDETDNAPKLCLNLGNEGEELDEHTVTFDNVELIMVDDSNAEKTAGKKPEASDENLIKNGDFKNGKENWGLYLAGGGDATLTSEDGKLTANVNECGTLNYGVQVSNQTFKLYKGGKYVLQFDIDSSVDRDLEAMIQLDGGDYHAYTWKKVNVTPETQTVVMEFTMEDDTDMAPKLCFNMGKEEGEDLEAHKVNLSNVSLKLVDASGITDVIEEKEEQKIVLNQLGYIPNSRKEVVFRGADVAGKTFNVVSKETGETVYTGEISEGKENKAAGEVDYYGDFSKVNTPGTYVIQSEELGESYEFKIDENIYRDTMKDLTKFFYYQRCDELSEEFAGKWAHPECHKSLARIYGTDEYIDVSGGWHDAGDYGRYVVATATSLADLLEAYEVNKDAFTDDTGIPESGNGISDILDECKRQFDWLFKMQNKENGGVYHKVTCANFPGYNMPEEETDELIVCPISTTATGDFAAIMAKGYEVYKSIDSEFADKCLDAAKKAYDYLEAAPSQGVSNPKGIVTGEYGDYTDMDERYWASAELFKATGDNKYHERFKELAENNIEMEYGWQSIGGFGNDAYLSTRNADEDLKDRIKEAIIKKADRIVDASKEDGYGVTNGKYYYWGSNMGISSEASLLSLANTISPNDDYVDYAREHVNYCFGKNANAVSFVTGWGTVTPKNPHHRPSIVKGEAIPGMIAGGVNSQLEDPYAKAYLQDVAPAKCYLDNAESYSINEVDIYWNSALVRALAKSSVMGQNAEDISSKVDLKVISREETGVNQSFVLKAKDEALDLSKVAVRYYFSKSDSSEMAAYSYNTGINYSDNPWYQDVTGDTVAKISCDSKGMYVEYRINSDVILNNDGSSVKFETGFSNVNWSSMIDYKGLEASVVYYK
ncbi:MAG: glycoside hydrolase family 9 protein [Clostridium sp.]|nr:glycoside hydrolase family 9 protein [Clostridium sp.]